MVRLNRLIGICILVILISVFTMLVTAERMSIDKGRVYWDKSIVQTENPFVIDVDMDTFNRDGNCISIDGRFFTDQNPNASSIPSGNKYLGFSADQQLQSGSLRYRNYQSNNNYVTKTGSDFSYLSSKYGYSDVYYLPFSFTQHQDKEFIIDVCFSSRPERMVLYFGTGSSVIEIAQSSSAWSIDTNYINFSGDDNRIHKNIILTDSGWGSLTNAGETGMINYRIASGQMCGGAGGNAGIYTIFQENGTIRTKFACVDNGYDVLLTFYQQTKQWNNYLRVNGTATGNYSFFAQSLRPEGDAGATPHITFRNASVNSNFSSVTTKEFAVAEGWACSQLTAYKMGMCVFWDINESRCSTSRTSSAYLQTFGGGSHIGVGGDANPLNFYMDKTCTLSAQVRIMNETGMTSDDYRNAWNSTFRKEAIIIVNNSGGTEPIFSAQELSCSQDLSVCDMTLTFMPDVSLTKEGGSPDVIFIEAHNYSSPNLYIYNRSDGGEFIVSDLQHHFFHNGTDWTFGSDDPFEIEGISIKYPANSSLQFQICDADSSACNTMDSSEYYLVYMSEGHKTNPTQRFSFSNTTMDFNVVPSVPDPVYDVAVAYNNTDLNCSTATSISDLDNNNMTAYFNITLDDVQILEKSVTGLLNGSQPSFIVNSSFHSKNLNVTCIINLYDGTGVSGANQTSIIIQNSRPLYEPIADFSLEGGFAQFVFDISNNISDIDSLDTGLTIMYSLNDTTIFNITADNSTDELTFDYLAGTGSVVVNITIFDDEFLSNSSLFTITITEIPVVVEVAMSCDYDRSPYLKFDNRVTDRDKIEWLCLFENALNMRIECMSYASFGSDLIQLNPDIEHVDGIGSLSTFNAEPVNASSQSALIYFDSKDLRDDREVDFNVLCTSYNATSYLLLNFSANITPTFKDPYSMIDRGDWVVDFGAYFIMFILGVIVLILVIKLVRRK